jgi:hypothetical protein
VRQLLPLDDWTTDRLLAGMVDPDDAPPGYAGLARVLAQTHGPVEAGDLAGRERIVAAVAAAVADASLPTTLSTPLRRRPMISRLLGTKLAAATLTTALLATGAAAATGSLPAPAQDLVTDVVDVFVPDAKPDKETRQAEHDQAKVEREADRTARKEAHQAEVDARKAAEGDDAGDSPAPAEVVVDEDVTGAAHGMYKGDPTSDAGKAAHEARDIHLGEVADRQAEHKAGPVAEEPAGEEPATPAAEQGVEAHSERDDRLAELDEAKAARDAEKAARPADEADEAGDEADEDADEADDSDADEDEDGKDGHEDDEDEAPADPAV